MRRRHVLLVTVVGAELRVFVGGDIGDRLAGAIIRFHIDFHHVVSRKVL